VTVRVSTTNVDNNGAAYTMTVDCGPASHALGGGHIAAGATDVFGGSYPATAADGTAATDASVNPRYWAASWSGTSQQAQSRTAFAICVPN
jgi:hypothetical protein